MSTSTPKGNLTTEELSDNILNKPDALKKYGGSAGLAKALGSDPQKGLSPDQVEAKRSEFGDNKPLQKKKRSLFSFIWEAMQDKTLIILAVAATVSIVLGVTVEDPKTGWIDGTAILVAVCIVIAVTAGNDYNKEKKFQHLTEIRDDKKVTVVRGGQKQEVSAFDLVVGDVVEIEAGGTIPADGVYLRGQDVSVDESPMTGESDSVRKDEEEQPFLLSGCLLLEGVCTMMVIAVGPNSQWGKLSALLGGPSEDTPLTQKLEKLSETIGKAGVAAATVLLLVLVGKWLFAFFKSGRPWQWSEAGVLVNYLISAIALIAVAVPEGLPLAVTISLAYSMMKMMKDQNLVRHLEACETMGGATNICSDKTGTLTENRMTVTKWWLAGSEGEAAVEETKDTKSSTPADPKAKKDAPKPKAVAPKPTTPAQPTSPSLSESSSKKKKSSSSEEGPLSEDGINIVVEGICMNSSAYLAEKEGKMEVVGNKTEGALLNFLASGALGDQVDYQKQREENKDRVEKLFPFSSENKMMSTLMKGKGEGKEGAAHRLYTKGAAEIVVQVCSGVMGPDGSAKEMDESMRSEIDKRIEQYASEGLRTIALAFRDMQEVPAELDAMAEKPKSKSKSEASSSSEKPPKAESKESTSSTDKKGKGKVARDAQGQKRGVTGIKDLVLVGLVGIKDPVRQGVPEAVKECQKAGIMVRMLTGDNVLTAQSIARECGILTEGGVALEGPKFREMSEAEMDEVLPKLQVLARMTPSDKYILVHRLRELGEVVAVTGDGVNDAPQLKEADVGFAMGSGTEVAKDASDIVLMDDNFASLVKAVMWGRNVYNSIRKFIQFQLTVNIVAVIVAFAGAVTEGQSPLTPVQLLWVNLIMDTFAALALATEAPTKDLLDRKPYGRNDSLITRIMWRNIIGQAVFQLALLAVMLYFPTLIPFTGLPKDKSTWTPTQLNISNTILFNTFVICQLFNEINCRNLSNDLNVFKRFFSNYIFLGVMAITILGQAALVQFAGSFAETHPLNIQQWLLCLCLGAITLPWGLVLRLVVRIKDKEAEKAPVTAESMQKKAAEVRQNPTKPSALKTEGGSPKETKGKETKKDRVINDEPTERTSLLAEEGRANKDGDPAEAWRRAGRKLSVVSAFRNAGRTGINYPSRANQARMQTFIDRQMRRASMPPINSSAL
eukprot:TRINITY_DN604_c1_g1_i5.p1 TRINITY_DN604_c1_g1~~TRINITY_DN604_c1_g1_i5.p1  ORF type:complete len:1175 (-),score=467.74 TRINITY_DN604_c1_g1_i5:38-3562(-)